MTVRSPEDDRVKGCPSFPAYDAKRDEYEAEVDPVAKRALQREMHELSDAMAGECNVP